MSFLGFLISGNRLHNSFLSMNSSLLFFLVFSVDLRFGSTARIAIDLIVATFPTGVCRLKIHLAVKCVSSGPYFTSPTSPCSGQQSVLSTISKVRNSYRKKYQRTSVRSCSHSTRSCITRFQKKHLKHFWEKAWSPQLSAFSEPNDFILTWSEV